MTILTYPIATIIGRKAGDVLHDDNIRMRKLHEMFRYECDTDMRKAAVIVHAPAPVSA